MARSEIRAMAVRATRAALDRILGEPTNIRAAAAGSTLMKYRLTWACGCKAEQMGERCTVDPCRAHYDALLASD